MNICLVNNLFPPLNTGSSHYTFDLAVELSKKSGNKVIVITNKNNKTDKFREETNSGFILYRLPVIKLPRLKLFFNFPNLNFSLSVFNFFRFYKILRKEKVEIIHQCNNIFDLVFLSAFFSVILRIPLFCTLTTPIQHTSNFRNKVLEIFDKTVIKYLFAKFVKCYISLDLEIKRYIKDRYKKESTIIPFSIHEKEMFEKIQINYDNTNFKMITIGAVSDIKNRIEIIRAWKYVVEIYPCAEIIIIGDILNEDTDKEIINLDLKRNVRLTGMVKYKEFPGFIQMADFGCMFLSNVPYDRGIGIANLELMASGLPTVLYVYDSFFGNNYEFTDGIHFIKLKKKDPQELAQIFIKLFEDKNLRENIGKKGKEFVIKVMTWDKIADKILELYLNIKNKNLIN